MVKLRVLMHGPLLCAVAANARATPSARLVYLRDAGTESCPDESALRDAVRARLGYDPFFPVAPATMFAEIARVGGAYRARIKLVDPNNEVRGTRELVHRGDRCEDMIDAIALSMSIAIDPESVYGPKKEPTPPPAIEPAEAPPPQPSPPSQPESPKQAPAPRQEPPPSPPPVHLDAGAAAAIWAGAAPAAAASGSLFVRVRWRRVSLAAEGRLDAPASQDLSQGTVETSLAFATVVPCVHFEWLGTCASVSVGSIRASSSRVTSPRTDTALHAAIGPRLAIELPLAPPLWFWAHTDVLATLTPQTLILSGKDVYPLPRVSGGAAAGLFWRFF